ncbi:MAG: cytochrome P450 [Pseudoprimorskyibacter sp.]|nr:cytochrome P450 [Pseudoprimorskyibacter sp.]
MIHATQSPTDPDFVQNPYPFYDTLRQNPGLVWWEDYAMPCAVRHSDVHALFRDKRLGRTPLSATQVPPHLEPFYAVEAHSMLELEPPRHTRLRGLVLRAFTSRRIAELGPEITVLCHELIDKFPNGDIDLLTAYAQIIPVRVIARLLGVPEDMAPQLLAWSHAMVSMYMARRNRTIEDAAATAAQEFTDFLRDYAETRRTDPRDDLITHLLAAEADGDRLNTDELITTCILLLNAGHEATVHAIGNGLAQLLQRGLKVQNDTAAPAVEEILRYDPPLHMFTRYVYEDGTYCGTPLKRGDEIALLLGAAGRDPAQYTDPHCFDITRAAKPHTAFGGGLHFCVGAPLARLEMQIALPVLFARCPNLRLSAAPSYADTYHFHGLKSLIVHQ